MKINFSKFRSAFLFLQFISTASYSLGQTYYPFENSKSPVKDKSPGPSLNDCDTINGPVPSQNGQLGSVVVKYVVRKDGLVRDVIVDKSSGFKSLDNAVRKTMIECKFSPQPGEESVIPTWYTKTFNFNRHHGFVNAFKSCPRPEYPRSALRRELEGTAQIDATTTDAGKINNIVLIKSSGYRVLDNAFIKSLRSCQLPPDPDGQSRAIKMQHTWNIEPKNGTQPELLRHSCSASSLLRIPDFAELGRGIVVSGTISENGSPKEISIEWESTDDNHNAESLRIFESCKFNPATEHSKYAERWISMRFLPK